MQVKDKMPIKAKLKLLLAQVRQAKIQLSNLYELHHQFQFSSLLPEETLKRKSKNKHIDKLDKENNLNNLNKSLNNISNTTLVCDQKYATKQPKKLQSEENFMNLKNQKDEIKDIKAGLIMQLCQIKSMQKKSESMRRTNEKINEYNFQQRKNYRESISKDKDNSNKINDSNVSSNYRSNRSTTLQSQNQSLIIDSKISVTIPAVNISTETKVKTLKCCKGHQFYDGSVNNLDQPHGNGRLQMCCPSMSIDFGGQCFKDSLFYQGQFKDGKFHGFGTLSYKGGVKYVGEFRQGRRHGKGSMYYNGKAEVANWQNDIFVSIM